MYELNQHDSQNKYITFGPHALNGIVNNRVLRVGIYLQYFSCTKTF